MESQEIFGSENSSESVASETHFQASCDSDSVYSMDSPEVDFEIDLNTTAKVAEMCSQMEKDVGSETPRATSSRAKRPRLESPSTVQQSQRSLQRDAVMNQCMQTMTNNDEWSDRAKCTVSVTRKAVAQFPHLELKYRSAYVEFSRLIDEIWTQGQATQVQQVQVIHFDGNVDIGGTVAIDGDLAIEGITLESFGMDLPNE